MGFWWTVAGPDLKRRRHPVSLVPVGEHGVAGWVPVERIGGTESEGTERVQTGSADTMPLKSTA